MRNPRPKLTTALHDAWEEVISKYYNGSDSSPYINSEAALQAFFFVELMKVVFTMEANKSMAKGTRIYAVPNIKSKKIFPDLIVCRKKSVIAVIELKYFPRGEMVVRNGLARNGVVKDFKTFERLYNKSQSNDPQPPSFFHARYLGAFSEKSKEFEFSKNTLFVWGGIHRAFNSSLVEIMDKELVEKMPLFEMHANTVDGNRAETAYFYSGRKGGINNQVQHPTGKVPRCASTTNN